MARSRFVRASCASASARSANLLRVHLQTRLGSKGWFSRIIMKFTIAWGGARPRASAGQAIAESLKKRDTPCR
eukprot:scaffold5446_cov123-Isochrysis_galbana.AAC.1